MKYPKCNQNPMSLVRFIFKFNRIKITCKNYCGTNLKAGSLIRRMFYGALIFGLALGISYGLLDFGFGILILVVIVLAISTEFVVWKYGRYEEQETV